MRYSKARIIITTIISISCFIFVIFVIYKGIDYAKKANGAEEPEVKASVTEKKEVKKKVVKNTKKETKKTDEKKTETKKSTKKETKKEVKKETKKTTEKKTESKKTTNKTTKKDTENQKETKKETKTTEEKKTATPVKQEPVKKQEISNEEEKEEGPTFDNSIVGKYVIKELTYEGKTYKKKEIDKLIKSGYSMNLEIKENGLAQLSVLSINHAYAVDDTYFSDGTNNIEYSHSSTRIRITVDNAKMLFIKK